MSKVERIRDYQLHTAPRTRQQMSEAGGRTLDVAAGAEGTLAGAPTDENLGKPRGAPVVDRGLQQVDHLRVECVDLFGPVEDKRPGRATGVGEDDRAGAVSLREVEAGPKAVAGCSASVIKVDMLRGPSDRSERTAGSLAVAEAEAGLEVDMCRAMADMRLVAVADGSSDSVAVEGELLLASVREEEVLVGSRRGKAMVCWLTVGRKGLEEKEGSIGGRRRFRGSEGRRRGLSQGHTAAVAAAHGYTRQSSPVNQSRHGPVKIPARLTALSMLKVLTDFLSSHQDQGDRPRLPPLCAQSNVPPSAGRIAVSEYVVSGASHRGDYLKTHHPRLLRRHLHRRRPRRCRSNCRRLQRAPDHAASQYSNAWHIRAAKGRTIIVALIGVVVVVFLLRAEIAL